MIEILKKFKITPLLVLSIIAFVFALYIIIFPGPPENMAAMSIIFLISLGIVFLMLDFLTRIIIRGRKKIVMVQIGLIIVAAVIGPGSLIKLFVSICGPLLSLVEMYF